MSVQRFVVILCAILTLATGVLLGRSVAPHLAPGSSGTRTDPAAVPVAGALDMDLLSPEGIPSGSWPAAVAVLLSETDWRSCEDLGRQLRELRRMASKNGIPIVFWTDSESFETNSVQLQRERLAGVRLVSLTRTDIVQGELRIRTPAAVLFQNNGRILSGVSHPGRYPNVRPVSFVEEIDWALPR